MSLRSPQFERALRRGVRRALRQSPALRRAGRRRRSVSRRPAPSWLSRVLLALFIAVLFGGLARTGEATRLALDALALWITGTMLWRALRLSETLYRSSDLLVYFHLPLTDEQIFGLQWGKYLRGTAWLILYFSVLYAVVALADSSRGGALVSALGLAVLQAAVTLALSCLALWWVPHIVLLVGSVTFCGLAVAVIYGALGANEWSSFARFLPAGWIHWILWEGIVRRDLMAWLLVLPAGAVTASVAWSKARLAMGYALREPVFGHPLVREGEGMWDRGETSILETIQRGQFLETTSWAWEGWVERRLERWLTARERIVADFLVGPVLGIGRALRRASWGALVCAAIICLTRQWDGAVALLLLMGVAFVAINALPLFQPGWRGWSLKFIGSGYAPAFAGFPFSYHELCRTALKINALRLALASPLALGLGGLYGWKFGGGWEAGLGLGLKLWLLAVIIQPVAFVLQTSRAIHEQLTILRVLVALVVSAMLVGLGIALMVTHQPVASGLCLGAMGAVSWLFLLWHRWSFNRGHFDLVRQVAE